MSSLLKLSYYIKEIQLSALQRENANLQLGDTAVVTQVSSDPIVASRLVLNCIQATDLKIDQLLTIYAREYLGWFIIDFFI